MILSYVENAAIFTTIMFRFHVWVMVGLSCKLTICLWRSQGFTAIQPHHSIFLLYRWEGRGEARLVRMLEEKPEKLVAALLVEQREEVRMAKDRVADLIIRKGNLVTFHASCDHALMARVCNTTEGRQIILRLVGRGLDSVNNVAAVGEAIVSLVTNPNSLEPGLLLEGLEEALSTQSHFVKAELLNFLAVRLNPP